MLLALKGQAMSRAHAGEVVSYLARFGPGPPPGVVGEGAALSIRGAPTMPWGSLQTAPGCSWGVRRGVLEALGL